nr:MAG TPA: hypothetical protein [Caudoviricetes sp.]
MPGLREGIQQLYTLSQDKETCVPESLREL